MTFPTHTIIIAAIILLCCTAGCISAPPALSPDKTPPATEYPLLSIRETPVQYADVNGVRLAYREFGSGEPLLVIVFVGIYFVTGSFKIDDILAYERPIFLLLPLLYLVLTFALTIKLRKSPFDISAATTPTRNWSAAC
jgi:hypothetical protein